MERRISHRGEMKFTVVQTRDGRNVRARAANLSATGIQLICYDEPEYDPNSVVQLELHLPGAKEPMSVKASPVWKDGFREGLRFVDVADADRLDLAEVLDRRVQRQRVYN
jgi:hypothetical protein